MANIYELIDVLRKSIFIINDLAIRAFFPIITAIYICSFANFYAVSY